MEGGLALPPSIWGPIFWTTIHIVSLAYPDNPTPEEKKAAKDFFESLQFVLPCPICRNHYKENLKELPIDAALESREQLVLWAFNIHNAVNKKLGKAELTLQEFMINMRQLSATGQIPPRTRIFPSQNWIVGGGAVVGLVATYYIWRRFVRGSI